MFRRKRSSSNPPRPSTTSTNTAASTAAAQAFLAHRASNANLSNAAAAAALRSHTTSPIPVAQIQTKRMQRSGSNSSNGSASARLGNLQRRDSGGSMTERSFRDPPANRPASSHGPYPQYEEDPPPPVPALPKNYASPPGVPRKSTQRPASVEPPARVTSPAPRHLGGRGISLDRGPGRFESKSVEAKDRGTGLASVREHERIGNRGSVNFSRPMSPANSPPISPTPDGRAKSPLPSTLSAGSSILNNTGNVVSGSQEATPVRQVKKKKKTAQSHEGSSGHNKPNKDDPLAHEALSPHSVPQVTQNTPDIPSQNQQSLDSSHSVQAPQPKKKKKKKRVVSSGTSTVHEAGEGLGGSYRSDTDSITSEQSNTHDRPRNYNTRAAGLLAKQPSVVREDREGEENAEHIASATQTKARTSQNGIAKFTNDFDLVSKDRFQVRKPSQQISSQIGKNSQSLGIPGSSRPTSTSPARAAHFSTKPVYDTPEGTKHQPPARSVSPAKSAMKNSPSRGPSPALRRPQGLSPSEASDTASGLSDDGSKSASRKKKNVRVSFGEDSVTVGRAAGPSSGSDSPVILSPQDKAKSRSWLDLVRDKSIEQDSTIKPTPTLPSFGSVRGDSESSNFRSAEGPNNSSSIGEGTSNDHALGNIVSHEMRARQTNAEKQPSAHPSRNDPLPPEVLSVEGSGYQSDEDEKQTAGAGHEQSQADVGASGTDLESNMPPSLPAKSESRPTQSTLPTINLQPATPGIENSIINKEGWLGMPGGFPGPSNAGTAPVQAASSDSAGRSEPRTTSKTVQGSPNNSHISNTVKESEKDVDSQSEEDSEDSTGDSVYSDAQSEPEGDGFGSINAIVESPSGLQKSAKGKIRPVSPTSQEPALGNEKSSFLVKHDIEPTSDNGWDSAQTYWSDLSQSRKNQLEQAAKIGAVDEPVFQNKTMRGANAISKKKKKKVSKSANPPTQQNQDEAAKSSAFQMSKIQPPSLEAQRNKVAKTYTDSSTTQGPSQQSYKKKKSQGLSAQESPETKANPAKRSRPVSAVAMVDYYKPQIAPPASRPRAASSEVTSSSRTPIPAQTKKKKQPTVLNRAPSNGSDSSSSFKRNRSSTPDTTKYTMKRSMRPSSVDTRGMASSSHRASFVSARASSPASSSSRRPLSSVGPGGMRTSMRASMDSTKPVRSSLRGSMDSKNADRTKSPSRFGFGKASKAKPVESKPASHYSSRFGDSSGDEAVLPTMNSSRFVDSSEEDEPASLTPVRGIPRRIDEGESTDLDDSSAEGVSSPRKANINGTQAALETKPEGAALATGSLRTSPGVSNPTSAMGSGLQAKKHAEKEKTKRSFFGSLSVRKREDHSTARLPDAYHRVGLSRSEKTDPLAQPQTPRLRERILGPSSPTADPVSPLTVKSQTSTTQNSPKSPKLQRRNTPQRYSSANEKMWPLEQSTGSVTSTPSRPRTSEGPSDRVEAIRPDIGARRSTAVSEGAHLAREADGRSGKKKRFPMLRKAFGLHN